MTTIAVTGVGGLVGRRLVQALESRPEVTDVLGLDLVAPEGLTASKLRFRRADVRDPAIADALVGVDVVVHLAFQLDPIHDEARMRAVNVDGTRVVLDAAARAGVPRVVYTSSVVAYGAHPDNDVPLTEDSPLRGTPGLNYGEHKRDVERWLWPWLETRPDMRVTVLRPALVLGPGVQNFITRILEAPRITAVKGHRPPLQFVHLDDLVSAVVHVVEHDLDGAYNVAAEGWLSFDEVTAIIGRRVVEVPEEVAWTTAERLWRLGIGEQPPGTVALFMHPWVMSAERLLATGWRPVHSNRDALAETVSEHADHVALVGVRMRRTTLWRAVGLLTAGVAALGWSGVRRLRTRHEDRPARA